MSNIFTVYVHTSSGQSAILSATPLVMVDMVTMLSRPIMLYTCYSTFNWMVKQFC